MDSKTDLLNYYLENYTPDNRLGFCKLAKRKYRFEKYKMSVKEKEILPEDRIVQDEETLELIDSIINSNECSIDDFKKVFNKLSEDQINYIGF